MNPGNNLYIISLLVVITKPSDHLNYRKGLQSQKWHWQPHFAKDLWRCANLPLKFVLGDQITIGECALPRKSHTWDLI